MFKKRIKSSKRGLTFSFAGDGTKFDIGNKYRYIVDVKSNKIFIVPSENGLKISKKKTSSSIKSLVDLRSKRVLDVINNADYLDITINKNSIVVNSYKAEVNSISSATNIVELVSKSKKIGSFKLSKKLVAGLEPLCRHFDFATLQMVDDECDVTDTALKVVSLFSGCGMFDKGFTTDNNKTKKKFEVIYALDNAKGAIETYKNNIGNHIVNEDIKTMNINSIPKANVLLAGPPCTPFSNANRTCRLDNHKDSELLLKTAEIINNNNYPVFVIENVPQILSASNSNYYNEFISELTGYNIQSQVLCDYDYGGYTKRKRVFIIGTKVGSIDFGAAQLKQGGTVRDALSKLDSSWKNLNDITVSSGDTLRRICSVPPGGNWKDIPKPLMTNRMLGAGTQSNSYKRLELDKPSCTLINYRKPLIIHPTENRIISVSEASALSGFGKDFVYHGSLSEKQLQVGNGVPFNLGQAVRSIVEDIFIKNSILGSV